jgi:hypothetical protein
VVAEGTVQRRLRRRLLRSIPVRPGGRDAAAGGPGAAAGVEFVTFTGFLAPETVQQPGGGGTEWQPLYLDSRLRHQMLIEDDGIVARKVVEDKAVPGKKRDLIWVTPNAAVGMVRGAQSLEAQFLTGEFTRAADFRAGPAGGGTAAAATGVFCEARSVGCCRKSS